MAGSRGVVIAALFANGAIAILKFIGFLLTASPSMLSETYHSISDTGNQVFLLIGLRFGGREADRQHPFGYGKAQFFYSFLVSVFLFGIAGWESLKHGYHVLTHGGTEAGGAVKFLGFTYQPPVGFDLFYVNVAVLLAAVAFESYAFKKAWAEMKRQMAENDWGGIREAFRKTSDVTTLTALTEDTIALLGLVVALLGITLARVFDEPLFDAAGALVIGGMLMVFAVALAWENKRLILGESLPADEEGRLRTVIEEADDVDRIVGFRTVYFGPEEALLSADVEFRPGLSGTELDERISAMQDAIREANSDVNKIYIEPEV
ncbi:cation diffusion facilitator family transporter [Halosimplex aquaticum]|uniref:Cation diffusion facilitator family transporter n=1 Tax=Halosimplex aquaticum TaxID=3026162 RepID=A0ABD5Y0D9_9EURY|nr:cation diffusion facilitator family transporter [Halosimplex aquaticum]